MGNLLDSTKTSLHVSKHQLQDRLNRKSIASDDRVKEIMDVVLKDGVAVVPNFYSKEQCEALRNEIDHQIGVFKEQLWKMQGDDSDSRLFGIERYSELINEFASDPFLWSLCSNYHKTEVMNMCCMAGKIVALDKNRGSGGGWHRDSVHIKQFKTIVYLSDVDETNGPFQYMKGSQSFESLKRLIREGYSGFNQFRYTPEDIDRIDKLGRYPLTTFTASQGTLICADTRGLHRGMPLQAGDRYALTNYFYAKHHATPKQVARFEKIMVKA